VNLVDIRGDQLVLDYNGGTQTLFWKETDLAEEAAKGGSAMAPATPVPPGAGVPAAASPPGAVAGTPSGN
jgi:hypothetical protein